MHFAFAKSVALRAPWPVACDVKCGILILHAQLDDRKLQLHCLIYAKLCANPIVTMNLI